MRRAIPAETVKYQHHSRGDLRRVMKEETAEPMTNTLEAELFRRL